MRPIHLVRLDKVRPAVLLTRGFIVPHLTRITVAPVTSTIRGIPTEVSVGVRNGLEVESVASCDNIQTVPKTDLGRLIGYLQPDDEVALTRAISSAFDLSQG